jgi:DNA-dependent RNA polymerase auxiliary subunit epsilon
MNKKLQDERLWKKPKYRIGETVVYQDRYDESSLREVTQSKIVESNALLETGFPQDSLTWTYQTEQTIRDLEDCLYDRDIMYKI